MTGANRILVHIEGGTVYAVVADRPEEIAVTVVDFDVDGIEEDRITTFPGDRAVVSDVGVEPMTLAATRWLEQQ